MPEKPVDVVISGAGPNGLMLAIELAMAGVVPIVLEQLPNPSDAPKANGLVGQVVRMLDMRGLYGPACGAEGPPQPIPGYIFSGLPLDLTAVPVNPLYMLPIPQAKLVRLLAGRLGALGVEVRWGHELVDLGRDADGVWVQVAHPDCRYQLDARYLVGADGGKSVVRKALGIDFPGHTEDSVSRVGHVRVPAELRTPDHGLEVPGVARLKFGHNRFERGMVAFAELEPGRPLLGVTEYGVTPVDEDTPMTFAELSTAARRVIGADLPIEPPTGPGEFALRRGYGQNTRLAERYRDGRVLLVGDAAHVHSAMGGPGLNLGLQDAVNLGWKLAAAVHGHAPAGLLDTYHDERHPVGQRVAMSTLAQTALMRPGPEITALRALFTELLRVPDNTGRVASLMAGADIRYDVGDAHPLSGTFVPEFAVDTADGRRRVAELLRGARPVLLDGADGSFADAAGPWRDRIEVVAGPGSGAPAAALLVRPDGYLAWAADSPGPDAADRLRAALRRWFGAPGGAAPAAARRVDGVAAP